MAAFQRGRQNTFDVFVTNLPKEITEQTLTDLFSPFGALHKVLLKDSRQPNDGNKIGFVKFYSKDDAEKAILERGGHMWDGNGPLIVKWALNRLNNAGDAFQSRQSSLPAEQSSDDGSVNSSSGKTTNFNMQNFTTEILRVTYTEDAVTFWAKPEEDEKSYLEAIHRVLYEECGKMLPIEEIPIKNKMYATQFSEDGAWYRCRIIHQLDDAKCVVRYVDFGNSESVKIKNIVDVPKKVTGKQAFAKRYRINQLEANDPMKLEKGKHFLGTKLYGKNLECKIFKSHDEDFNYLEILNAELKNLADELVMLKYATTIVRGKATSSSSIVASPPKIEGLLQERNAVKIEVLNLQSQLSSAQEQIRQLSTMLARNDFDAKMTAVVDRVSEIQIYRTQFVLDDDSRDPLLMAEKLLLDNTRVLPQNLLLLPIAKRNLEKYEEIQSAICKCSKEELKSKVEARDAARCELHETLEKFIGEVAQLPLQERLHSLEEVIRKIMQIYQKFLDIQSNGSLPLEILMEHYKNFKKKNESKLAEIRSETDSYQVQCQTIFHQLQNALCVEDPSSVKNCPKLPIFLDHYNVILEKELELYRKVVQEETNERSFVAKVVQKLMQELNKEKNYVLSLVSTSEKYINLEKELRPWLTQKPDLSSLNNLRREIKRIKSKLRHLLANQQDLEEMEGDDDDTHALNMEIAKEEISITRQELHNFYELENEILKDLSHTAKIHFPELVIEYPEMEMKYNGVVQKRSYEEYDIEVYPKEAEVSLIFKTEYNGRPKILQEFIVNTPGSRDEFLRNMDDYVSIKSDYLVPVEIVFFTKNERQVYMQMPFYEKNLLQFLTQHKVNNEARLELIQNIVNGVAALHSRGLVHGGIRPENVWIDERGKAMIAPFNFTLSLDQRRSDHPPIKNLTFLAPELLFQANSESTMASDVFALGCLALWIRQSKQLFVLDENGIPDITLSFKSKEEDDFFSSIFKKDPEDRVSAQELMSFPFVKL